MAPKRPFTFTITRGETAAQRRARIERLRLLQERVRAFRLRREAWRHRVRVYNNWVMDTNRRNFRPYAANHPHWRPLYTLPAYRDVPRWINEDDEGAMEYRQ